jgi:hypothetical protein
MKLHKYYYLHSICFLRINNLNLKEFLSVIFLLDFRPVPTVLYFVCVFHVSFCLFCFVFFVCLFLFIFCYVNNRCKTCKWSVNSEISRDITSFITITTQSTSQGQIKQTKSIPLTHKYMTAHFLWRKVVHIMTLILQIYWDNAMQICIYYANNKFM